MIKDSFYLVWDNKSKEVTYKHNTFDGAKKEATRLAINNPNKSFTIMLALQEVTPKIELNWDYFAIRPIKIDK